MPSYTGIRGSTLVLVDLDAERLAVMTAYARRLNESAGAGLQIRSETDRRRALPGAEFVITSVRAPATNCGASTFTFPTSTASSSAGGRTAGRAASLTLCATFPSFCPSPGTWRNFARRPAAQLFQPGSRIALP
jgi:alpha-galactosidase